MSATIQRFNARSAAEEMDSVHAAIAKDGAVIIEGLLSADVVARVNEDVGAAIDDIDQSMFDPIMEAFHGPMVRQYTGMPGLSRTFATEVMCNPILLGICDRVLLPSCARYQLNLGHLLERGPGAKVQWLHRDEVIWPDMPKIGQEIQLASVIAFVDFTRENGATRLIPGSHLWPDRALFAAEQFAQPPPDPELMAYAEMPAGAAVVYSGGTLHGGGANTTSDVLRRGAHLSYCLGWLRTEENHYLGVPPSVAATLPRLAQELLGYAAHNSIDRGGGYLGMLHMADPIDLLARGDLSSP